MSALLDRARQGDDRRIDVGLSLLLTLLLAVFIAGETGDVKGSLVLNGLLGSVATLSLIWRRHHPVLVAATTVAVCVLLTAFLTPSFLLAPTTFSMMVASYSSGAFAAGRASLGGLAIAAGGIGAIAAAETPDDILFPLMIFGFVPWLIGRTMRTQTRLARELAEQEARVRHMREQEAATAIAAERSRVARELHDVLAHNLSVMVIQASAARRALRSKPDLSIEAASLIERTGREALVELRHMFGPVRHGEGEALDGSPGLSAVGALVERSRDAGLPVSLRVEGDPVELGPGADMAAYRLIQEGLTNTLKHAGTATTEVRLEYRPDGVTVEVTDEGDSRAPAVAIEGGGHGLVGMRERVALYGGDMHAGPNDDGGYTVRASIPLDRDRLAVVA